MLIDDVIEFCDQEYKKKDCVKCNSKIICDKSCNSCKRCLDDIHFERIFIEILMIVKNL